MLLSSTYNGCKRLPIKIGIIAIAIRLDMMVYFEIFNLVFLVTSTVIFFTHISHLAFH